MKPIVSPVLPDFHAKYLVEKDLRVYYQDLVYGLCSLFDEGDNLCIVGQLRGKIEKLLKKNAVETENNAPDYSETASTVNILSQNEIRPGKVSEEPKIILTSSPLDDSWLYHKFVDVEPEAEIKKLKAELAYWKHAATEIAIQRDNAIHVTACDIVDLIESEFDIDLNECNCQSCIDTKCTQEHLAKLVRDRYCPEIEYNLDTDSEPLDLDTLAMIDKF